MKELGGIIVPIVTPMYEDESVNLDALRVQIDRLIAAGVHGIFCFGTNGEAYILTDEEKEAVLEATVEQVNGRVPVYAGTGCVSTNATIRMSRRAKAIGADRIELYTGPYAEAYQNRKNDDKTWKNLLQQHASAAAHAQAIGLGVNAGHDLNTENLPALVSALPMLDEVSIGHALTVDALYNGLAHTIAAYKQALQH